MRDFGMVNGFSAKQVKFIELVSEGVPTTRAAERAGYVNASYEQWRLLGMPAIRQAIQTRREQAFIGDIGTLCMQALEYCLVHGKPDVRLKAAVYGLEVGGIARKVSGSPSTGKPDLLAMSEQELLAFVRANEQKLLAIESGGEMKDVTPSEIEEILS